MPFKSYAQESFLKHQKPAIYKRWLREYGKMSGQLPKRVKKKK